MSLELGLGWRGAPSPGSQGLGLLCPVHGLFQLPPLEEVETQEPVEASSLCWCWGGGAPFLPELCSFLDPPSLLALGPWPSEQPALCLGWRKQAAA